MRNLPGWRILLGLAAYAVSGCAASSFGRTSELPVLYPTPPDTARIHFLLSFSNERDVRGRVGGFIGSLLDEDPDIKGIEKPYGIDFRAGKFYICDSMLPGVVVVDVRLRTFEQRQPGGQGVLQKPINCTIDGGDGSLWVVDTQREQIVVFDAEGTYRGVFGGEGDRPTDVFVDDTEVFVVDQRTQQVKVYDKATGDLDRVFPSADLPLSERISKAANLFVRGDLVYVTDVGAGQVKVYRTDGTFVRNIGEMGRAMGQFIRPKGIAVDRDGRIYALDTAFQNVQMFDAEGRLLMDFGGGQEGPGGMSIPAQVRITYEDLDLFRPYVDPAYELEYVVMVTNQYGPNRVNLYGFIRARDGTR